MRLLSTAARRLQTDEGSALTEFAIIAPIFILLMIWSEFFTDVGIVKLKTEEASRYALWELTVQRDPSTVDTEIRSRFRDLNSPQDIDTTVPATRSFPYSIAFSTTYNGGYSPSTGYTGTPSPLLAQPNPVDYPAPGNLWSAVGEAQGYVEAALERFLAPQGNVVQNLGFNMSRMAQVTVSLKNLSPNAALFPGGRIMGFFFDTQTNMGAGQVTNVTFTSKSPMLLVDTWKAWPGPNGSKYGTHNAGTDPLTTYSRIGSGPNAVELELSARLKEVAFNGGQQGIFVQAIDWIYSSLRIGGPLGVGTWQDPGQVGPVIMLPGAQPTANQPFFSGVPVQRVGDVTSTADGIQSMNSTGIPPGGIPNTRYQSPSTTVDRMRYTMPSHINSSEWMDVGGLQSQPALPVAIEPGVIPRVFPSPGGQASWNEPAYNPYPALYENRDAFYMGALQPGVKRWANSNYWTQAFGNLGLGGGTGNNGW